jgi:TonB family protein
MHLFAIRFLVALLTFGVGVAASSLLSFKRPATFEKRVVISQPILVTVTEQGDVPPPPPRACNLPLVNGGVLNGKAISKPLPVYPPTAKAAGLQGTVNVQIMVDEAGYVMSAQAVSGPPLLQQAAVEAARQARFTPTRLSGQPVKVSGLVSYNFMLE